MLDILRITLNTKVTQKEGNIVSDMDGEKVMLNIQNGKYYNLGKTGGVIWELITVPQMVGELVDKLLKEYEVEKSECEKQVITFLYVLYKEDLIIIGN